MRQYQRFSAWLTGSVTLCAILVTISFQNCGKAGFDANSGTAADLSLSDLSTKNAGAPFAFDSTFDQISYMSCIGGDANKDAFYSVRAGGYENGGLKLTDAFLSYAKSKIPAIYPATAPSVAQLKQYLSETAANVGAAPQVAVRSRTDLRSLYTASGSAGTYGIDYLNVVMDPTDDRIMDPLFYNSGFTNYFSFAPLESRNFQTKINYNTNEAATSQLRKALRAQAYLALTYASALSSSDPRGLQSTFSRALGRGYLLDFRQPGTAPYKYSTEAVMFSVKEIDLNTSAPAANWSCALADQIKIVRVADRAICPMDAASRLSDPTYRLRMQRVRRHLKAEYWDVSIDRACAVPKVGECYSTDAAQSGVEYNPISACYDGVNAADGVYGATLPVKRCAQYVSFCFRQ